MKIFTKIVLVFVLGTFYINSLAATFVNSLTNDGVYIPKTPVVSQPDITIWLGKSTSILASNAFSPVYNWTSLSKNFAKLSAPKKYPYSFTANSSNTSMLGVSLHNSVITWDEGKLKASLNAYPNPAKGKFTISLSQASKASYKITLSNTIGQVIKTIVIPESAQNNNGFEFDLSDKPAGVYFYSLIVNDKMVETKRLILQ